MSSWKGSVPMAQRNRQTFRKHEREMAKKQKKQDKAERIAARKADRTSKGGPLEVSSTPSIPQISPSALAKTEPVV